VPDEPVPPSVGIGMAGQDLAADKRDSFMTEILDQPAALRRAAEPLRQLSLSGQAVAWEPLSGIQCGA
jgi:hypothetical protein